MGSMKSVFVFLISVLSMSPLAQGGGTVHGGGGNICISGRYAGNLTELADTSPNSTGFTDREGVRFDGEYVQKTLDVFHYIGFDILGGHDDGNAFFKDSKVRLLLKNRIHDYIARAVTKNPDLSEVLTNLEKVVGAHPFLAFNDVIPYPIAPGALTKLYCSNGAQASIRFSLGFGFLSMASFNKMTLNQQAWLLIHESLRWMQQNGSGRFYFSDTAIERITRAIILNNFDDKHESLELIPINKIDVRSLLLMGQDFLKSNKSSALIEQFYNDVIYEGPIAIYNDLLTMTTTKEWTTVDVWADQKDSEEVSRYRERAKELLKLTGMHSAEKVDFDYFKKRIDKYQRLKKDHFENLPDLITSTLAFYAEFNLLNVFKTGRLYLNPHFESQSHGQRNILMEGSGPNTPYPIFDSKPKLESCACAIMQKDQLETQKQVVTLYEHALTLNFDKGKRHFFALPILERENAFCIAIAYGTLPSDWNAQNISKWIRIKGERNYHGLNECGFR